MAAFDEYDENNDAVAELEELFRQSREALAEAGLTVDDLLADIPRVRAKIFRETYGISSSPS